MLVVAGFYEVYCSVSLYTVETFIRTFFRCNVDIMSQSVPVGRPKNRATDIEHAVQNRSSTRERVSLSVTPDINCLLVVPH